MPNDALSDARLIRRSQQGDREAFVVLSRRYDARLRGLVYALTADDATTARVLRTAYLKAWRDVVRVRADDDAGQWLYRMAYNACIDELRLEPKDKKDEGGTSETPDGSPEVAAPEPDEPPLPPTPSSGARSSDPVARALAALLPEERVALVMMDREGFPPKSAARILGVAEDVLLARLLSARASFLAAVPPPPPGALRSRSASSGSPATAPGARPPTRPSTGGAAPRPAPAPVPGRRPSSSDLVRPRPAPAGTTPAGPRRRPEGQRPRRRRPAAEPASAPAADGPAPASASPPAPAAAKPADTEPKATKPAAAAPAAAADGEAASPPVNGAPVNGAAASAPTHTPAPPVERAGDTPPSGSPAVGGTATATKERPTPTPGPDDGESVRVIQPDEGNGDGGGGDGSPS